jgi:hypothetical protein
LEIGGEREGAGIGKVLGAEKEELEGEGEGGRGMLMARADGSSSIGWSSPASAGVGARVERTTGGGVEGAKLSLVGVEGFESNGRETSDLDVEAILPRAVVSSDLENGRSGQPGSTSSSNSPSSSHVGTLGSSEDEARYAEVRFDDAPELAEEEEETRRREVEFDTTRIWEFDRKTEGKMTREGY